MKIKYFTKITFTKEIDDGSIFVLNVNFDYDQITYEEVKRVAYEKASVMEVDEGYIKIKSFEIIKEERV